METLKNKITFNNSSVRKFIIDNAGRELSRLSTPCYYPKTKKVYHDLLSLLKITDKDMKEFVKRTYTGTIVEKFKTTLFKDVTSNLFFVLMHMFLQQRDRQGFSSTLVYFIIVHYSRLMHHHIRYCHEETFKYTLDTITKTHLFTREKTISNSLYFLSTQLQGRFEKDFKEWNIEGIILFLTTSRTRIAQSIKSFARHYYKNRKMGAGIKTQDDYSNDSESSNVYQYQVLTQGQKIIDDIVKDLTMYKSVDRKAFNEAQSITKIKTSIATIITNNLSNKKHIDNIKILLQLYLKEIKNVNMICGGEFYDVVKKAMTIKRTSAPLYFKTQVNILLIEILKDSNFDKIYETYTKQNKFAINSFLAFYIALILRGKVCST